MLIKSPPDLKTYLHLWYPYFKTFVQIKLNQSKLCYVNVLCKKKQNHLVQSILPLFQWLSNFSLLQL